MFSVRFRASLAFFVVTVLTLAVTSPALAAPPTNDTFGGATVISVPFSETVDTTEATTDAADVEWNATCGAPATDASIWYSLTAAADGGVVVDVTGSDYSAGIAIVIGTPGTLETIACAPGLVGFGVTAGATYSIVVFDDQFDGSGNGGSASVVVDVAPPPPTVDITVDPTARFNAQTGGVTVTGTATCTDGASGFVDLTLEQRVGRFIVRGFGGAELLCDGTTQPWSAEIFGDSGLFKGGRALALTFGVACNVFDCAFDEEVVMLRLRG